MNKKIITFLFSITFGSTSCGKHPPAQVIDGHELAYGVSAYHHVARGETLYAIAWAYGMDFHTLASINCLPKPYIIHQGQSLRLRGQSPCNPATQQTSSKTTTPFVPKEIVKPAFVPSAQPQVNLSLPKPTPLQPKTATKPVTSNISWHWPARGPILQTFDGSRYANNGIDIGGQLDAPIYAAKGGEVVYAGSGLRGYGQLIIIKHSEDTLSAYAHNHSLLVHEGQAVTAGQVIAKMGYSGTNRVKLHFEIRVRGQPTNPLTFLPH